MTGFSKLEKNFLQSRWSVEVKSVNHRYLESKIKLPYSLYFLEQPLSQKIKALFTRGFFDLTLKQFSTEKPLISTEFYIDEEAHKSFQKTVTKLKGVEIKTTLQDLLQTNRIILYREPEQDLTKIKKPILDFIDEALEELKKSRELEGKELKQALLLSIEALTKNTSQIEKLAKQHPENIRKKLLERIEKWKPLSVDDQKLESEVAFFADKSDVTEEIIRLNAHFKTFKTTLQKDNSGRNLDFMTQEMNREINTIASKCQNFDISQLCIQSKSEIEKIREQVQNVQ